MSAEDQVQAFISSHTPQEAAILEAFQEVDILEVIWEPEIQLSEYVMYAEEFVNWLKVRKPTLETIVHMLHALFDDRDKHRTNPLDHDYRELAQTLYQIIYLFES